MRKYDHIDLSYFIENGLDEPDFIKEIIDSSIEEFQNTINKLEELCKPEAYDSEALYNSLHKLKPTADIYKIKTYPIYQQYGAQQKFLAHPEFMKICDELIEDLKMAHRDLLKEKSIISD